MGKKKSLKSSLGEDHLDLKYIESLGGEKEDLKLLQGLSDEDDDDDDPKEVGYEEKLEIHDFVKKLGFPELNSETHVEPSVDVDSLKKKTPKKGRREKIKESFDSISGNKIVDSRLYPAEEVKQQEQRTKKLTEVYETTRHQKSVNKGGNENPKQNSDDVFINKKVNKTLHVKLVEERGNGKCRKAIKQTAVSRGQADVCDAQQEILPDRSKKTKKRRKKKEQDVKDDQATAEEGRAHRIRTKSQLLVKPGIKWFEHEFKDDPNKSSETDEGTFEQLQQLAAELLDKDTAIYNQGNHRRTDASEFQWMKTVRASGTLSDKLAAYTVMIQKSPVHSLQHLRTLLGMVSIKGRRQCIMALGVLQELFLSDLLVTDHKLREFQQHPLHQLQQLGGGNQAARDKRLLLWYFEDQLKKIYASFVQKLDEVAHDNVSATKKKAITTMFELLSNNPEQEQVLLSMMVDKLGAPDRHAVSKATYQLNQLLHKHPNMKYVVMLEVERLIFRPNITPKAQYYGMCFLNQLLFSWDDAELAEKLISIYFLFFRMCIKKGEVDSKLMNAILTGINRAYPYAKLSHGQVQEQINTLYKILHLVNFNTTVQALQMLFLVTGTGDSLSDRFYCALYKKLLDPQLTFSSYQAMFLNLVYKAMKRDECMHRVKAFIKRLLQVCEYQPPHLICGLLVVISETVRQKPGCLSVQGHPAELEEEDDEEEHYDDADKCEVVMKKDEDNSPEDDQTGESNSCVLGMEINREENNTLLWKDQTRNCTMSSWVHRQNLHGNLANPQHYTPEHRNPLHCGAEHSLVWELERLKHHYHPSVALFAQTLIEGRTISYNGDPLENFTTKRFLDRFVLRNPKKDMKKERPNAVLSRKPQVPSRLKTVPVNHKMFLNEDENKIPVEELFFYKFYHQKKARIKTTETETEEADSDVDSVASEEFQGIMKQVGAFQDIDMDFAMEVSTQKKDGQKRKRGKSDRWEDDDDEELEDDEPDFSEEEDFQGTLTDYDGKVDKKRKKFHDLDDLGSDAESELNFDEEKVSFSDEDEDFVSRTKKGKLAGRKHKLSDSPLEDFPSGSQQKSAKQRTKKHSISGLFASAEEFAHVIEENAGSRLDTVGTHALSNRDNAGEKQLKWELSREKWTQRAEDKSHKQRRLPGGRKMAPSTRGRGAGKPAFIKKGKKKFLQNKPPNKRISFKRK